MRWLEGGRTLWARLGPRGVDVLLAIVLSVGAALQFLTEEPDNLPRLVPVIGTALPLAWRRQVPLVCNVLQVFFAIVSMRQPVTVSLVALFVGAYSVALYSRWRMWYLAVPFLGALSLGLLVPQSAPAVPSWVLELVGGLGIWSAGNSERLRRGRMADLEERARRLERERELETRVALADERQRIARELHDVVAHSVSVMVVQAGAARAVLDRKPDKAVNALLAVEASGREALAELRHLLGLLTDPALAPALAPQPGLAQLEPLVERVRQAGLPVALHIDGRVRPLSPGLDLAAYRIVQEALTNALKYAAGGHTDVRVTYSDADLRLEIRDAGGGHSDAPEGAGRGLLGMRERIAVYGGELRAGRQADGGFAVRVWLPLDSRPGPDGQPAGTGHFASEHVA